MFGRKKEAFIRARAPMPTSRPERPAEPPAALPRRCPLTQSACRDACAWMVEGECAAAFMARELFTLVEVLARGGGTLPLQQPGDGGLPTGAVVLPQNR